MNPSSVNSAVTPVSNPSASIKAPTYGKFNGQMALVMGSLAAAALPPKGAPFPDNYLTLPVSMLTGFLLRKAYPVLNKTMGIFTFLTTMNNMSSSVFGSIANPYTSSAFMFGQLLADQLEESQAQAAKDKFLKPSQHALFSQIHEKLNKMVIGHHKAKTALAEALATHYQRFFQKTDTPSFTPSLKKTNVLLIGQTGSGKTELIQAASQALDVPTATINAARLTNEGSPGLGLETAFSELYQKAGKNLWLAERGIIFLEETDKLFSDSPYNSLYNHKVQAQLLDALQGAPVTFKTSNSLLAAPMTMSTKDILFVMTGAFSPLGNHNSVKIEPVTPTDLINYGMSPKFVGQIGHIIELTPLKPAEFKAILLDEQSKISLPAWQKEFKKYGIALQFDEEVIDQVVALAMQQGTCAYGIDFVLREHLTPLLVKAIESARREFPVEAIPLVLNKSAFAKHSNTRASCSLNDLKAYLDAEIVGQDSAKQLIAEAIHLHYYRISNAEEASPSFKGNLLLVGPSGTGKTKIMEEIAKKIDIPMVSLDASRFTRQGIIGLKPEDALLSLLAQAKGDLKKAEQGIIFLDEMDKVFEDSSLTNTAADVAGNSVQNQLLRMLQGDTVRVNYHNQAVAINTKNILFVMAGAFSKQRKNNLNVPVDDKFLLQAGMKPEFLGRIGYIATLNALSEADLKQSLTHGSEAPLNYWTELFKKYNKTLSVQETTIDRMVKEAMTKATGMRGLHFILSNLLRPALAKAIEAYEKGLVEKGVPEMVII